MPPAACPPVLDLPAAPLADTPPVAPRNCNKNDIPDECDIASGFSLDNDLDGIPDECDVGCGDCPTDVNDDDTTGPFDLATLLGAWGPTARGNCLNANGDVVIGPPDLAALLGAWGPCL